MITQIELRHFKCFRLLKLPLQPLTLLSGGNAAGKSTVLQALALLHQTMREQEWSSRLFLNGSTIRLGTAAEVIDQESGSRSCGIGLMFDKQLWIDWEFEGNRNEMSMFVRKGSGQLAVYHNWDFDGSQPLRYLLPQSEGHAFTERLRCLTYLTAERLGPREHYLLDDPQLTSVVGPCGEYTTSVLYSRRDSRVSERLLIEDVPPTLFRQVEARMAQFFPGFVMEVDQVSRTNTLTLGIRVSKGTEFHRPVHTGFGLTQVLPIVVAALSAQANDLLLIENPEVHLHPAAQGAMGHFLAQVAATGVQVIIETHSDHVLNGIRRAVKGGVLVHGSVAFHFFSPRTEEGDDSSTPQVESPTIDSAGNIDSWPEGFFDQFDQDMNHLAGWD